MADHRPPPNVSQPLLARADRRLRPVVTLLPPAALLLACTLLYLFTLDNGLRPGELAGGDLITHQYAQVQGRPSNAPGYPLYTMGGWLWFRVGRLIFGPHANPISILSSYSTLWALVALWLLYWLILEVTQRTVADANVPQATGLRYGAFSEQMPMPRPSPCWAKT